MPAHRRLGHAGRVGEFAGTMRSRAEQLHHLASGRIGEHLEHIHCELIVHPAVKYVKAVCLVGSGSVRWWRRPVRCRRGWRRRLPVGAATEVRAGEGALGVGDGDPSSRPRRTCKVSRRPCQRRPVSGEPGVETAKV